MHIHAQRYMNDGISRVSIPYDSVFNNFVPPKVPLEILDSAGGSSEFWVNDITIVCIVKIDTGGKVSELDMYPLYGYGNDFKVSSYVWRRVLQSIDSVSKYWVFKPILHDIKENYTPELKEYLKKMNTGKASKRPFMGRQKHIILLNLHMPFWDLYEPQFLYFLNVNIEGNKEEGTEEENIQEESGE